jgi:AcrR family transcriptional regulator
MTLEPGSDLSQRIMRAAKTLFFAKGYARTQLRTIAAEAGTSESGVLRLYQSKAGVLRAVYASCWAEINDHIDQALAVAARDDSDPRNLVMQLIRTVLEGYQANPPMNGFMISHFGIRETSGLSPVDGIDPEIDAEVRSQYHRYLSRINDLSVAVADRWPGLARAGVTSLASAEILTSIIYGIQNSWYMADEEHDPAKPRVSIEEALTAIRFFLYPATDSC